MRIQDLQQLKKAVQSPHPLVAIVSKEALERKNALAVVVKKENATTFSADSSSEKILAELHPSLFIQRPIVVVQQAHLLPKATVQALVSYCNCLPQTSCLILEGESLSAELLKIVETSGILLVFPQPKPWEKEELLAKQLATKKLPLSFTKEIVRRVQGSSQLAEQEIAKLLIYVDERAVTQSDLDAIVVTNPSENIWQLADAVLQRDGKRALVIIESLLRQGEAFIAILALLRSQIRNALLAATLPLHDLAKALPKIKGKRLEQLSRQGKAWGSHGCKEAFLLIHQTDLDARSGVANTNLLADRLIARLVQ